MARLESLSPIRIDVTDVQDKAFRLPANEQISFYLQVMAVNWDGPDKQSMKNLSENIKECHRNWFVDAFHENKAKAIMRIFHCKNKFCTICQKKREMDLRDKYFPLLDLVSQEYDLYHLTNTVKNPLGMPLTLGKYVRINDGDDNELKNTISSMTKNYKKLIRYLSGDKKIKGIDFSKYGFKGAIRSLECAWWSFRPDYHPHFHSIVVLKKGLDLPKVHENTFSKSKRTTNVRLFSDLEILIQKIWYLINNDQTVTKNAIDNLEEGYSCAMDLIKDGKYHEVFKYAIKPEKLSRDEKGERRRKTGSLYMPFKHFVDMYYAMYRVRCIQGYGCFHKINFEEVPDDNRVKQVFNQVYRYFQKKEKPESMCEHPVDILKNIEGAKYTYFSKGSCRRYALTIVNNEIVDVDIKSVEPEPDQGGREQLSFYEMDIVSDHELYDDYYIEQLPY